MDLGYWQQNWDNLGKDDPLWVVLTDPSKQGGRWDVQEFFDTGKREVQSVLTEVSSLGVSLARRRALDFGCGVGRLSQALAAEFDEVHGVDIAPSMVEHANRFNRFPGKCRYHLNSSSDLRLFTDGRFDFIYSNITLQHIEPAYAKRYIREFIRVLNPGGAAVFQLLEASLLRGLIPQFIVTHYRKLKAKGGAYIGMFGIPERQVTDLVTSDGGRILSVRRATGKDLSWRWVSVCFFITKPL